MVRWCGPALQHSSTPLSFMRIKKISSIHKQSKKMTSERHVSSILINGSGRLIVKKSVSPHFVDSSRTPSDCVWSLHRCDEQGGNGPVSLVRTVGGMDAVRELVQTIHRSMPRSMKEATANSIETPEAETFYSTNTKEEKTRLANEDISATFPFSFKCACLYGGPGFTALIAMCLSFEPKMRGSFSNALTELGLGDEVARWVVAADERRIHDALLKKGILCSVVVTNATEAPGEKRFPNDEMSDAILKLCVHCDVTVDFLALRDGTARAVKAPRLYTSSGERHVAPDRYGGTDGTDGTDETSSLIFVSRDDYRPDLSLNFRGRITSLVAALVPHLGVALVHMGVHSGRGTWIEANRRLARCGVGPIHHTVLVRYAWWAEDLLFSAETFAKGGRGRHEPNPRSIVWIYAS